MTLLLEIVIIMICWCRRS